MPSEIEEEETTTLEPKNEINNNLLIRDYKNSKLNKKII